MKIKCPLVIYPGIVTEKEWNGGQQSIPGAAAGKESLKDEAGILTKELHVFLWENAALYNSKDPHLRF